MRSSAAAALSLAVLTLAVPAVAEAGSRRRVRPAPASPASAPAAVKSDELVRAAIAATPTGGTCVLPSGVFRTAVVLDRSMTLVAAPTGTAFDATGLGLAPIEILAGATDVTIDGLRLSGSSVDGLVARGGNDRLTLRRVSIVGSAGVGARIAFSSDVVLERTSLDGNLGGGLDLVANRGRLVALSFRGNGGANATLGGQDVELLDSAFEGGAEGVRFTGRRVRAFRPVLRAVAVAARFASTSEGCVLSRADVRGATSLAVADEGSVFGTVEDSRCDVTAADAIRLAGSWHVIDGNALAGSRGAGIVGDGTSIRILDNALASAAAEGVRLDGDGNTVEGNRIASTGATAVVVVGSGCVVAGNACTGAGGEGVRVTGASNVVMENETTSSRREGLWISGDANTLQGNRLVRAGGAGIRIDAGLGNLVLSNSIVRCGGAGFEDDGFGTVLDRNRID